MLACIWRHIYRIIGSDYADTLTAGTAAAITLEGRGGNDLLVGGSDSDVFDGGAGDDSLVGGGGENTYVFAGSDNLGSDTINESSIDSSALDFSGFGGPATINLSLSTAQFVKSGTLTLNLSNGGVIENVIGSDYADVITGNSLANHLDGGEGNDTINGGDGSDSLIGGAGADSLAGGSGHDTYVFAVNSGADTVDESGGGTDTLDFSTLPTSRALSVNLGLSSTALIVATSATLTFTGAEIENVIGGAGNDTIIGNSTANKLTGNGGDDSLAGGGGNDLFLGGSGADTLTGDVGDDTYLFVGSGNLGSDIINEYPDADTDTLDFGSLGGTQGITIKLGVTTAQTVNGSLILTLSDGDGLENVMGTTYDDWIVGNSRDNRFIGFSQGMNLLDGNDGNDTYVISIGGGKVFINEGVNGGLDTLDFSALGSGVNINLSLTSGQVVSTSLTIQLLSGQGVENVIGTNYADVITGNVLANRLDGGAGNDALTGGDGDDLLIGGAGNDSLAGGADNDTYVFATGSGNDSINEEDEQDHDTLDFSALPSSRALTIDLGLSISQVVATSATLTLSSDTGIENVIGGAGNDSITGNSRPNSLDGGVGNDILTGGDDADTLVGGLETIHFQATPETISSNSVTIMVRAISARMRLRIPEMLTQSTCPPLVKPRCSTSEVRSLKQ